MRVRVAAVIDGGESVLMVRHVKEARTYWLFPGGGVERGESLHEALRRELSEEVGLRVRPGRLLLVCEAIEPRGGRHILNLFFRAQLRVRSAVPELGGDAVIAELAWKPWAELAELETYPPVGKELLLMKRAAFRMAPLVLGNTWVEQPGG